MLVAVSDLHVSHPENRRAVEALCAGHCEDWLILGGDVADDLTDFEWVIRLVAARFYRVIWVPGNHELWCTPKEPMALPGEMRYRQLIEICHQYGVLTPEDDYPVYTAEKGQSFLIAPIFTLYDYSFRHPSDFTPEQGLERARRAGAVCSDAFFLKTYPYPDIRSWCTERVQYTEARLNAVSGQLPMIFINHFPMLQVLTQSVQPQEFSIWCGTQQVASWLSRYPVCLVVYGHLHMHGSTVLEGIPHVEVSLGYPKDRHGRDASGMLTVLDTLLM
ncbi:metallophosphoesterase family protein [Photobacterium arenosum]|uniref:metallophosphoesterase family protein n=1 Tax=Photobacterium arenosum TaxID=2774143 RepID=UPI00288B0C80|nr:metallophosphoesterase [Photobacterium arenosum]